MPCRALIVPAVGTGVLMAAYLLIRPYGDTGSDAELVADVGSARWLVAHVCGVLVLASFARLCLRAHDDRYSGAARVARWASLTGVVLVVPYYGAETFALHVLARRPPQAEAVTQIAGARNQPVALTTFGLGLLLAPPHPRTPTPQPA